MRKAPRQSGRGAMVRQTLGFPLVGNGCVRGTGM